MRERERAVYRELELKCGQCIKGQIERDGEVAGDRGRERRPGQRVIENNRETIETYRHRIYYPCQMETLSTFLRHLELRIREYFLNEALSESIQFCAQCNFCN